MNKKKSETIMCVILVFSMIFSVLCSGDSASALTQTDVSDRASEEYVSAEDVFDYDTFKVIKEKVDRLNYAENNECIKDEISTHSDGIQKLNAKADNPTLRGAILVTTDAYKNLIPTGHAAVLYSKDYVIEALADGVQRGKNNWVKTKKEFFVCEANGISRDGMIRAMGWCDKKRGKPYNYNYYNIDTRDSFYCSHLIYAAYKDYFGIDMNTKDFDSSVLGKAIHPIELVSTPKTNPLAHIKNGVYV